MPPANAVLLPIRTAAVALVGGLIAVFAGLPSPWMTGPMFAAAAASLFGVGTHVPSWAWVLSTGIIGIALGTGITPAAVGEMGSWPLTLLAVLLGSALIQVAGQFFLQQICGWDRASAFFGSMPGAFSVAITLSAETKADLRLVIIAQSMRIFLLLAVLPVLIVVIEGAGTPAPARPVDSAGAYVVLVAVGAIGGAAGWRLKLPAGALLGAMVASGLLHGSGLSQAALPSWLIFAAFAVMGVSAGGRFLGTNWALIRKAGLASIGASLLTMAVSGLLVLVVMSFANRPLPELLLAFAPGGMDAMSALALTLHLDSAFVAVHQLVRITLTGISLPFLVKWAKLQEED